MDIKKKYFFLFFVSGSLLFFFQNCSDVSLELKDYPSVLNRKDTGSVYSICPQTELKAPKNTKFIFAIDMSLSNIGDFVEPTPDLGWYWTRGPQTDIQGQRLDAINDFLSGCGQRPGNEFLALGFSSSAGTIVQSGNNRTLSCQGGFGDAQSAVNVVSSLKQAQIDEIDWYETWMTTPLMSNDWPGILGPTSYSSALNCIQTVMTEELATSDHIGTETYRIFMISDGSPNDGYDKGCEKQSGISKDLCYAEQIDEPASYIMQLGLARQKNMYIQGISYGAGQSARAYLDQVSRVGNTGSATALAQLEDFSTALCESIISQAAVDYQPDFASAINLTTIRKSGKLQADSDIDGLSDEEELALGYDPRNPRSSQAVGVLDGICERLGGKERCKELRDEVNCSATDFNSLGLSQCDIILMNLSQQGAISGQALDSDEDGMPDFIEIVKGTDPLGKDMSDDPDSDGFSTRNELLLGRDPFHVEGVIPDKDLTLFSTKFRGHIADETSCQYGAWEMHLKNVPTVEVLEVEQPQFQKYSHEKNVQMIYVFYRLDAQNTISEKSEFFGVLQQVQLHVVDKKIIYDNGQTQDVRDEWIEYIAKDRYFSADFSSFGKVDNL